MAGRIAYLGNIVTQGLVLDLDAGIKGSYPGVGTTWSDISNNGNNGTLTNGPLYTGSDYGAIVFDGVDDFVAMSLSVAQGQGNQTYSHWIKITSSISSDKLIFFEETTGTSNYTRIGCTITSGSYFQFGGRGTSNEPSGNGYFKKSSSPILPNLWTNVIGLWDVTNSTIKLYINGSEVSSSFSGAGSVQTHANTLPGTVRIGSSRNSEYFPGSIANTQIYNKILSPFEIWQNFNAYKSRYGIPDIVTDGLVLNLDAGNPYSYLSGSSGTTWTNTVAVSSSISGTLVNGPVYSNGAITFDGVDDYVNLGNVASLNFNRLNPYTFSIFFKSTNVNPAAVLLGKMDNSIFQGYTLYQFGGRIYTDIGNFSGTPNALAIYTSAILSNNIIYNAVVTYDGSSNTSGLKIYLNSIIQSTSVQYNSLTVDFTNTAPFYIAGRSPSAYPFPGSIYTAQIYNRALSQTEITQNFNALRGRYGV